MQDIQHQLWDVNMCICFLFYVAGSKQCSGGVMLFASELGLSHWHRDTSVIGCSYYRNLKWVISEINMGWTGSRRALQSGCLCFPRLWFCRRSPRVQPTPVGWCISTFKQQPALNNQIVMLLTRHFPTAFFFFFSWCLCVISMARLLCLTLFWSFQTNLLDLKVNLFHQNDSCFKNITSIAEY